MVFGRGAWLKPVSVADSVRGGSAADPVVKADLTAICLSSVVGITVDVASAAAHCPYGADLAHRLSDQPLFHRDQRAAGDRGPGFLLSQAGGDRGDRSQVVGLAHQFAVAVGGRAVDMPLDIGAAELSDCPLQVGEGVGGDLDICTDADKGQPAGSGVVDRLTVEGVADAAAQMAQPFRQALRYGGVDLVRLVRSSGRFDVGHGQIVF